MQHAFAKAFLCPAVVLGSASLSTAATAVPEFAPTLPQVCSISLRVLDETVIDTDFYALNDADRDAYIASLNLAQPGAEGEVTCIPASEVNTAQMYFGAEITGVEVTSSFVPGPEAVAPVAPVVGQTVTGSIIYDTEVNTVAEDLVGTPEAEGLTAAEIDALLPGGLYGVRRVELDWLGTRSVFGGYTLDRDAERTYFGGTDREFTLPNYFPVALGNDVPESGDIFSTAALRVGLGRIGGAIFDIGADINLLGKYVFDACEDADNTFAPIAFFDALTVALPEAIAIEVQDARPDAETASLFPGASRVPDVTVYPTLSGAQTNRFQWSFTQVGTNAAVWERIVLPEPTSNCTFAVAEAERLSSLFPSDFTPYLLPVQTVTVTGQMTYLSPTAALTEPPVSVVPVPTGIWCLAAGLGLLGTGLGRRRSKRSQAR